MVTSSNGTFSASVTIDKSAPPGIFSLTGSGTHDGAILNAVTFALGAFSVTTGNGPTYLAIFGTGLDLSIEPTVTVGGVSVMVQFFGNAPCCMGLEQIYVLLPDSLAGAGRVEVVLQSGNQTSNAVEVVLLPKQGQGPFSSDRDNQTRSRELAALAYVPGTSLALLTDENDDVVRVVDVSQRKVTHTIALPDGAEPVAVAVNASGSLAVAAERGLGQVAIIDLTTFMVTGEVKTGMGPVGVAIAGNDAVVVNSDVDSVTVVDVVAKTGLKTLTVGRGPRGVAADAVKMKAFVTNEDDGTVSVIDLAALTVSDTITLGASLRPAAIQLIPGSNLAVITVPSAGNKGEALLLNLTSRTFTQIDVNPDRSGGSSDIAVNGTTVYFANQTGGSVSFVPISIATGLPSAAPASIKVDLGARALAIDTKDKFLLVTNEGSGTIVLVDLATNKVVGRIDGVRSEMEGDDGDDDHGDHDHAANLPVVSSLTPLTAKATSTFTLTINGANLTGATDVIFVNPADVHGEGKGKGKGDSPISNRDAAFAAGNILVNSGGTQLTATIKVTAAALGPRVVLVQTPNGASMFVVSVMDTLTVVP
jgi:YVTN family beta-propeller protein